MTALLKELNDNFLWQVKVTLTMIILLITLFILGIIIGATLW